MNFSIVGPWWIVLRPPCGGRPTDTLAVVFSPQSSKPLLLGVLIDVGTNDEGHKVEERNPSLFWQELLGKRQTDWRRNPANPHHGPEASSDGSSDLMEGAGTCNDGHEDQVNGVLDGGDLKSNLLANTAYKIVGQSPPHIQ